MNLVKEEYQNVLAFLDRVEAKGLAEVKALTTLALKLEAKIANWGKTEETQVVADINKGLPSETTKPA